MKFADLISKVTVTQGKKLTSTDRKILKSTKR